MFDTAAEASQKLTGCVVFSGTTPVWCGAAFEKGRTVSIECRSAKDSSNLGPILISKLDIQNLGERVGYFNFNYDPYKVCVYGRRIPVRRSQATQGLSDTNVRLDAMGYDFAPGGIRFSDVMNRGGSDSLSGKYPTLAVARYQISKTDSVQGLAFDKNYAIQKAQAGLFNLHYKGHKIGWTEDLERFRIEKNFRYLDEDFDRLKMEVRS